MTTRTWNGSNDSYNNAGAWSPNGVPVSGDIAIINSGTVTLGNAITGVGIQLNQANGATASTTLTLSNATLDATSSLTVTNSQPSVNNTPAVISIAGTSTLAGTQSFYGASISFVIPGGSNLVNTGTMNFYSSSPITSGGGTLTNNGTLALVNPTNRPQVPVFNDAIAGTGTIALGTNARLQLSNSVSAGQTIVMNDGASGNEILQLDRVGSFGGTISGFSASDLISVTNIAYTNYTYTNAGNSGTLSLYSGSTLQGTIALTGQYNQSSFGLTFNDFGGGQSNLQITTTAVNAQSAGLPPGYQNGNNGNGNNGGSGTVGAVYRFFDNKFGTHFFTSDVGERNTVLATRSADLIQETNGFGDVQQNSTSAVAVYRFFDKNFGTHFFTANAGERDTIINTRSDLTYEANSTFYEHSTQQSGDTAVYRLFDTKTGTQFLTGDTNE
ncbi:MAG: hypothetical protein EON55_05075, partial [Alphaproteobacteria bacterium]